MPTPYMPFFEWLQSCMTIRNEAAQAATGYLICGSGGCAQAGVFWLMPEGKTGPDDVQLVNGIFIDTREQPYDELEAMMYCCELSHAERAFNEGEVRFVSYCGKGHKCTIWYDSANNIRVTKEQAAFTQHTIQKYFDESWFFDTATSFADAWCKEPKPVLCSCQVGRLPGGFPAYPHVRTRICADPEPGGESYEEKVAKLVQSALKSTRAKSRPEVHESEEPPMCKCGRAYCDLRDGKCPHCAKEQGDGTKTDNPA